MRIFFFILLFACLIDALNAQDVNLQWVRTFGNTNEDLGLAITIDESGNVYTVGAFTGTIDFDPGPEIFELTAVGPTGRFNGFISKLNAKGDFVWARQVETTGYSPSIIELDGKGNIYYSGGFRNTVDFDPGPGIYNLTSTQDDSYVVKLDSAGNFIWGLKSDAIINSLIPDNDGNIYATGIFMNAVDFDPGPGVFAMTSLVSYLRDLFVFKLDEAGNFVWAKMATGTNGGHADIVNDIALDNKGNVYVTGGFYGTVDFNPGPGIFNLTAEGRSDLFVMKFDPAGNFIFATRVGSLSLGYANGRSIFIDKNDNVYTAGFSGNGDILLCKINQNGSLGWTQRITGIYVEYANSVAVDEMGNIYITGEFDGTVDFDPGPGVFNLTTNGISDMYILKLSNEGNFIWVKQIASSHLDQGISIRIDNLGNIYTTGYFSRIIDFDPEAGIWNITSQGNLDIFILKLSQCKNFTYETLNITSCNRYKLNSKTYTTSGTYTQLLTNVSGCDSIITLNLTITNNTSFSYQDTAICQGDSYLGYTSEGIYKDTLVGTNGCDSIRTLKLFVNPVRINKRSIAICQEQFYFAGGANQTLTGVYKDTLRYQSGCDSIITITNLVVNASPVFNLGLDRNLCLGQPMKLEPGTFYSYKWQDQSTAAYYTVNNTGTYWVKVTDNNNCSSSDTLEIKKIVPLPSNFINPVDSLCRYEKLQLRSKENYAGYLWSTGSVQPSITVEQPDIYTLTVKDDDGCSATETVRVAQKEDCNRGLFIPTAFTPNGDLLNDVFKARVSGTLISFRLEVYNRYGELVFITTDPQKGWNGKFKNTNAPTAVFTWQCSYRLRGGDPVYQKGTITLIR